MAINVTNLRSFWHVAQHLSFTQAAEAIGVSQPVLTRQVKTLEQDYGVILFNRTTRRLALTQEGHKLRDLCKPIFEGIDDAEVFLRARKNRKIKLYSVAYYSVSDFLMMVKQHFPHHYIDVEIMGSNQIRQSLIDRECDFGILTLNPAVQPELNFFVMGKGELIAIVPENHPWSTQQRLSLKDLNGQNLIVGSNVGQSRSVLDRALNKYTIEPRMIQTVNSNELIYDLSRKGYGIGIMGSTGPVEDLSQHQMAFEEREDVALTVHFACRKERLETPLFSTIYNLSQHILGK